MLFVLIIKVVNYEIVNQVPKEEIATAGLTLDVRQPGLLCRWNDFVQAQQYKQMVLLKNIDKRVRLSLSVTQAVDAQHDLN